MGVKTLATSGGRGSFSQAAITTMNSLSVFYGSETGTAQVRRRERDRQGERRAVAFLSEKENLFPIHQEDSNDTRDCQDLAVG